jgi:single-stranded DNA-binding protein
MINKVRLVGKLLPVETRKKESEEKRSQSAHFSLLVTNPSSSITAIRCIVAGELAEKIECSEEKIIEVNGYIKNEKDGRQIIVRAKKIEEISNNELDLINKIELNQVRILGKVISLTNNFQSQDENKKNYMSFKIVVPREGSSSIFFCRVQGGLMSEFEKEVKKGDIVIVEGFLQTKKIENEGAEEISNKVSRISSIICNSFVKIDNDSPETFSNINLDKYSEKVKKIDFSKPKTKNF